MHEQYILQPTGRNTGMEISALRGKEQQSGMWTLELLAVWVDIDNQKPLI